MALERYLVLICLLAPIWLTLYYVVPYFTTYKHLRRVPGPILAKFSNIWIASGARRGKKFASIHDAHEKYGKVVRVGYNHVSIATPEGLRAVYAHGNGFIKDHFYEAFVSGVPGVFNVRDRAEHTRKRKIIAHAFAPSSVHAFEPHIAENLQKWVQQLDRVADQAETPDGFAEINMSPWCTFIAFDIVGDLAFGAPFGMVTKGRDECEAQLEPNGPVQVVRAAEILNRRGEVSATLGYLLPLLPWARYLPDPFFSKGAASVRKLHGVSEAAVSKRLDAEKHAGEVNLRHDILDMLVHGKDSQGNPLPRIELVSEALTQLIAGSDTTSNTATALFYWILHGERTAPGTIIPRLQAELDAALSADDDIAVHEKVKDLAFLRNCINEGMRLHSTSATGLPRIVTTPDGMEYEDFHFPEGTVLSVPSFTIHHEAEVWGNDVEEFKPDRWLTLTPRQKVCFNPFSHGPRACVGQNLAIMELALIIATAFRRYEFELYQEKLECHEGFSKKPDECWVGIRRRSSTR